MVIKAELSFCFLIVAVLTSPLRASDIETYLSSHESTRASLRSFHVQFDFHGPKPFDIFSDAITFLLKNQQQLPIAFQAEWIVEGRSEKIVFLPLLEKEHDGLPCNYSELILRDGKQYVLDNWDRENPPLISPSVQGSVLAHISFQSKDFFRRDPGMLMLFTPRVLMNEPRLTLRELLDRFKSKTIVADTEDSVTIQLHKDSLDLVTSSQFVEVTLSKRHGHLVSSVAIVTENNSAETSLGKNLTRAETRVVDFFSLGEGVFFPKKSEHFVIDAYKKTRIELCNCEFRVVDFNEDISDHVFELQFPKDVVVKDGTIEPNKMKWFLWGENNQALQEVKNTAELQILDKNPAKIGKQSSIWSRGLIFLTLCTIIALLVRYFRVSAHHDRG